MNSYAPTFVGVFCTETLFYRVGFKDILHFNGFLFMIRNYQRFINTVSILPEFNPFNITCSSNTSYVSARVNHKLYFLINLIYLYHCFNDTRCGIQPAFKLIFHLAKQNAVSNIFFRIHLSLPDRRHHDFKIFSCRIAAAH
jgi:hypothetical protein